MKRIKSFESFIPIYNEILEYFQELEDDYNITLKLLPVRKGVNDLIIRGDFMNHLPLIKDLIQKMENMSEFQIGFIVVNYDYISPKHKIEYSDTSYVRNVDDIKNDPDGKIVSLKISISNYSEMV